MRKNIIVFLSLFISVFSVSFSVFATEWIVIQATNVNTNDRLYKTLLKTWPLTFKKIKQIANKTGKELNIILQEIITTMKQKEQELLSKKKKVAAKRYTYLIHIAQKELQKQWWVVVENNTNNINNNSNSSTNSNNTSTDIVKEWNYIDLTKRSTWVRWFNDGMRMFDWWDGYIYYFEGNLSPTDQSAIQDTTKYFYLKDIWFTNLYAWTTWIVYWKIAKSWLIKVSKQWMFSKVQEKHYWNLMMTIRANYLYYKTDKWMKHDQALSSALSKLDEIYNVFSQFQSESDNDTKIFKVYRHILENYTSNYNVDLNRQNDSSYINQYPERQIAAWVFDTKNWVCWWYTDLYHAWLIFARINDKIATKSWTYPGDIIGHIYLVIWWRESDIMVSDYDTPFVTNGHDDSKFTVREL